MNSINVFSMWWKQIHQFSLKSKRQTNCNKITFEAITLNLSLFDVYFPKRKKKILLKNSTKYETGLLSKCDEHITKSNKTQQREKGKPNHMSTILCCIKQTSISKWFERKINKRRERKKNVKTL